MADQSLTVCNIILIDDDKLFRENLAFILERRVGHNVWKYRDIVTFDDSVEERVRSKMDAKPLLIILDIMLAENLDAEADEAPRLDRKTRAKGGYDSTRYRDDSLGLRLAKRIRNGEYEKWNIEREVPIIILTCRRNEDVSRFIEEELRNTLYLPKPQNMYEIQNAIEKMIGNQSDGPTKQSN
jgi:CheY-like chemotaxis protein